MSKVLIRSYSSYGKGDNAELEKECAIENSKEARKQFLIEEDFLEMECYESIEKFISNEVNSISFVPDGDWDDPTGYFVEVVTKEEALEQAHNEYVDLVESISNMFDE